MSPVTELVELRLTRSFDEFLYFFEREQLPVLLKAPGIISVRTGPKLLNSNTQHSYTAVSITLWDALEAHQTFLRSNAAKEFFQRVSRWTEGPPDVLHYEVGGFQGLGKLPYVMVIKTAEENVQLLKHMEVVGYAHRSGNCVEDRTRSIRLIFSPDLVGLVSLWSRQGCIAESFGVHVRSTGFAFSKAAL